MELQDPSGFPRLNRDLLQSLRIAIAQLQSDAAFDGAVVCGTQKCFCAGAELSEIADLYGPTAMQFAELGQSAMQAIESSRKPIVAAICGYCMGGGLDLALACDLRLASPDAVLAHRGAALGVLTGWGGTQRLARLAGPSGRTLAKELMVTGRTLTAAEAYNARLVSRVMPASQLMSGAAAWIKRAGGRITALT